MEAIRYNNDCGEFVVSAFLTSRNGGVGDIFFEMVQYFMGTMYIMTNLRENIIFSMQNAMYNYCWLFVFYFSSNYDDTMFSGTMPLIHLARKAEIMEEHSSI